MLSKSIERRHRGSIFQAQDLHESLTALQNFKMGLKLYPEVSISDMDSRNYPQIVPESLDRHAQGKPSFGNIGSCLRPINLLG